MATPAHSSGDGLISAFANKERTGEKKNKSAFLVAKQSGKSKSFSSLSHLVRLNLWSPLGITFMFGLYHCFRTAQNTQVVSKIWTAKQATLGINKSGFGFLFRSQEVVSKDRHKHLGYFLPSAWCLHQLLPYPQTACSLKTFFHECISQKISNCLSSYWLRSYGTNTLMRQDRTNTEVARSLKSQTIS